MKRFQLAFCLLMGIGTGYFAFESEVPTWWSVFFWLVISASLLIEYRKNGSEPNSGKA